MRMTDEQIAACQHATEKAKKILRKGDRINCSRCGGINATYTFSHWDGNWAVSKSGIDDLAAIHITKINGVPVDFKLTNKDLGT